MQPAKGLGERSCPCAYRKGRRSEAGRLVIAVGESVVLRREEHGKHLVNGPGSNGPSQSSRRVMLPEWRSVFAINVVRVLRRRRCSVACEDPLGLKAHTRPTRRAFHSALPASHGYAHHVSRHRAWGVPGASLGTQTTGTPVSSRVLGTRHGPVARSALRGRKRWTRSSHRNEHNRSEMALDPLGDL